MNDLDVLRKDGRRPPPIEPTSTFRDENKSGYDCSYERHNLPPASEKVPLSAEVRKLR